MPPDPVNVAPPFWGRGERGLAIHERCVAACGGVAACQLRFPAISGADNPGAQHRRPHTRHRHGERFERCRRRAARPPLAQFRRPLLPRPELALARLVAGGGGAPVFARRQDRRGVGVALHRPGLFLVRVGLLRRDECVSRGLRGRPAGRQRDLFRGRFQRPRRRPLPGRPVFPRGECGACRGRRRAVALPDRGLRLGSGLRLGQKRRPGRICLAFGLDLMGRHRRLLGLEYPPGPGGQPVRQPVVQP